ncbi:hypothetical protein [Ferrimonas marina]|uniref:Uncharacterized protein n=1 Tax=Ferrimonas marina TaxID=299255 RepID=A0A1M5S468_9GAMM|nr:hypothetical protein [Ferrimonas marina]SHH33422.1 hypothetical protein SAMN02745129_1867 [Ferrimonas marina]
MTQSVRSILPDSQPVAGEPCLADWQLNFLLRKLSIRRNEQVLVYGQPDRDVLTTLAGSVSEQGSVVILEEDDRIAFVDQMAQQYPQIERRRTGPSSAPQQCDVVVVLPNRVNEPFEPLLDQAWRRLRSGGRILLALPESDDNSAVLHRLMEQARKRGFVSRYRRCCDKHCAWVGVKYGN